MPIEIIAPTEIIGPKPRCLLTYIGIICSINFKLPAFLQRSVMLYVDCATR